MSRHDGRILVKDVNVNLASTNLNNSTYTQILAPGAVGSPSIATEIVRADVFNTSADTIIVGIGGSAGGAQDAFIIGPGAWLKIPVIINITQGLYAKSVFDATLSSGYLSIGLYN